MLLTFDWFCLIVTHIYKRTKTFSVYQASCNNDVWYSPSKWLRNSLVTWSCTFHNDNEGHRICMVITLVVVKDSKAWSGWHGDNPITRNTSTANYKLWIYRYMWLNTSKGNSCLYLQVSHFSISRIPKFLYWSIMMDSIQLTQL